MNLQQLEYVDAVSRHRSLRAASETLGVTPQALSRAIGALERELSAQIFERAAGGVSFTAFGATLHPKILQALRLRDQITDSAASGTRRRLSLGMGYVFATSGLAGMFCKAFDDLGYEQVDFVSGANVQLTPRVAAGELDFAFTSETPETKRLTFKPCFDFGWTIACRAGHPLARSRDLAGVGEFGFVAAPSPNGHVNIERAAQILSGRPARITATCEGIVEIMRVLQVSDRIAILPDTFSADLADMAGLELIPAPDLERRRYGVLSQRRPPVGLDWESLNEAVDRVFSRFAAEREASK